MIYRFFCNCISKTLRCHTLDRCRDIQKGSILFKRLGKYSVLFSIAITTFINDIIAMQIAIITGQFENARQSYNETMEGINAFTGDVKAVTDSVLYRWTCGWFHTIPEIPKAPLAPTLDQRTILVYHIVNGIQFTIFLMLVIWCLRWVYADCKVQNYSFGNLILIAAITNAAVYIGLRGVVLPHLG